MLNLFEGNVTENLISSTKEWYRYQDIVIDNDMEFLEIILVKLISNHTKVVFFPRKINNVYGKQPLENNYLTPLPRITRNCYRAELKCYIKIIMIMIMSHKGIRQCRYLSQHTFSILK